MQAAPAAGNPKAAALEQSARTGVNKIQTQAL